MSARRQLTVAALALAFLGGCSREEPSITAREVPRVREATNATDPALAIDPTSGDLLLAWLAGDSTSWRVYVARSVDQGSTWSAPVAVTPAGEPLRPHAEASPRLVAAGQGRLGLAWTTSREIPDREWPASDVRFARSLDGGLSWSAPITLNDDTTGAPGGHSFHDVVIVGDSGLVVAWLDGRPGAGGADQSNEERGTSIYVVRSNDFGASWGPNEPQWSRVCPCCRVRLAAGRDGRVYASWRKHYPDEIRDVVAAEINEPPVRVHADDWKIQGCPHSGPPIIASDRGNLRVTWFTGAESRAGVYFQVTGTVFDSSAPPLPVVVGERLPTAHVSAVEVKDGGTAIACDVDSTGSRVVSLAHVDSSGRRIISRQQIPGSASGSHPQIVSAKNRNEAFVVWSGHQGEDAVLRLAKWVLDRPRE